MADGGSIPRLVCAAAEFGDVAGVPSITDAASLEMGRTLGTTCNVVSAPAVEEAIPIVVSLPPVLPANESVTLITV